MILVTGATGFVGRALVPRLVESGTPVRVLVRPSKTTPQLPRGVALQVAVAHLNDERGVRAALSGVDTIIHLATAEWKGRQPELNTVDIQGTITLLKAARAADVDRIVYLSHLGADKNSYFTIQRTKGIVEDHIRKSGLEHLILRTSLLYGANDAFTTRLAMLLAAAPGVFPLPSDGRTLLQPLWVEDLVTCVEWGLEDPALRNLSVDIGGPEFFTLHQILEIIMARIKVQRNFLSIPRPYLTPFAWLAEAIFSHPPISRRWLQHVAVNRTCELASVTRFFSLKPSRFEQRLGYLENRDWRQAFTHYLRGSTPTPER